MPVRYKTFFEQAQTKKLFSKSLKSIAFPVPPTMLHVCKTVKFLFKLNGNRIL